MALTRFSNGGTPHMFYMQMYSFCEGPQTWQESYIKHLLRVNKINIPGEKSIPTKMARDCAIEQRVAIRVGHTKDTLSFTQKTKCLPGVINEKGPLILLTFQCEDTKDSNICKIEDYHLPTFPASNAEVAECEDNYSFLTYLFIDLFINR